MQHDYVISNDTGANVRADINNVLQAILTNNSGATQPSATQAGMFWGDISNASTYYLKIRNHTNDGWVSLYAYDVATKTIQPMVNGSTASSLIDAKVSKVSSTDNAIVRFDGTSGAVQNSSVVIDDSGNVGIGTSSPSAKLDVVTSGGYSVIRTSNGTSVLNFGVSTDNTTFIENTTAQPIRFMTNYTERMRIDSDGNVGIGTSSPSEKLHIKGKLLIERTDSSADKAILTTNSGVLDIHTQDGGTTSGVIRFLRGTNTTESMRIDSSGNVGIGVTPSTWGNGYQSIQIGKSGAANPTYPFIASLDSQSLHLGSNAYYDGAWKYRFASSAAAMRQSIAYNGISWYTAPSGTAGNAITWTTAMALDVNNTLSVNSSYSSTIGEISAYGTSSTTNTRIIGRSASDTSDVFLHRIAGVTKSAILANGSFQSATNSYGSTSDIKLKENIVDTTSKLDKLMQVQVRNFNYIGEEQKQIGVVAQEIEEIFPSIVYETKDTKQVEVEKERIIPAVEEVTEQKLVTEAVFDEEGNVITEAVYETVVVQEAKPESIEKYTETETVETGEVTKNVKYSVIYMMMLKGMQEQQQIIDDLTARIKALEVK